jgi:hypothetical protein
MAMTPKKKSGRRKIDWKKVRAKGALDVDTVFTVAGRRTPNQKPGLSLSRYAGKCHACEGDIVKGEWVSKSKIKGIVHPKCIGKDNEQAANQN